MSRESNPFYSWLILGSAISVLTIGFSLSAFALPVFYPELIKSFHWSRTAVAAGGSFKTLLVGLIAPLNGWFIDRKGVKQMMMVGLILLAGAWVWLGNVNSLWAYFAVCLLLGVGGSWTHYLPTQILVADWFTTRVGLAMGILTATAGIGQGLTPILSSALIQRFGWALACKVLPAVLVIPMIAVIFIVRRNLDSDQRQLKLKSPQSQGSKQSVGHRPSDGSLQSRTAWLIAGALFLSAWAEFSVWQHFVLFFQDRGFSAMRAASMLSVFLVSSTAGCVVCGPLSDRFAATTAMLLSLLLLTISTALLPATVTPLHLIALVSVFGVGYGGAITARPLLIFERFTSVVAGKVYGVATAAFTCGGFLGPIIAGRIRDETQSYRLAYLLALILMLLSVVLIGVLRRMPIANVAELPLPRTAES